MVSDCSANDTCCPPNACGQPMRYIQPAVAQSFKPCAVYKRSNVPMDSDTVYKTSYYPCLSQQGRIVPMVPQNNLTVGTCEKMVDETVTSLSYPGHCCVPRQKPIYPCSQALLGSGPMQDLTTNKHDYVAKPILRRPPIKPRNMIYQTPCPLEKETVHRLSFPAPPMCSMTESYKPVITYKRPCIPMDCDTTHGCSYMPVCPPMKEIHPWAVRPRYQMPCVPIEKETTYKLSYLGGSGCREPCKRPAPSSCVIMPCGAGFDDRTVYKESFLTTRGSCRPEPVRPVPNLCCMPGIKMDGDTMYGLAYPGHFCVPRQAPIRPCNQSLLGSGPMQDLTTQKHDYVSKPMCRRPPIRPRNTMEKTTAPLSTETTSACSYMPFTTVCPTVSFKPVTTYKRSCVPMDTDTTHQLSFQPVCPPQKECHEWAKRPRYVRPCLPMETETVQKLSYPPPGRFVSGNESCCIPPIGEQFPRAAVC